MKIFKYLLFLILIAVIGASVYFGTQDGSFEVTSQKTIQAPTTLVFQKANDLKEWQKWGPWGKTDTNMNLIYGEKTSGEGASYTWESDIEGNGSITTIAIDENKSIDQLISFETPLGWSSSEVFWKFQPNDSDGVEVTWGMKGTHSFLEKVFLSFEKEPFAASLKKMFDEGLSNMDALIHDEMNQYSIAVEGIKEYGGGYYLFTTAACKISELVDKRGPMLERVNDFAQHNQIETTGNPFTIYNQWDTLNDTVIFSVAMPVKDRVIITEGDVLCGYMEPLSAIKTVLTGNYSHLKEAYLKAEDYIYSRKMTKAPDHHFFEIYTIDPNTSQNPASWVTEIYVPVLREINTLGEIQKLNR